MLGLVSEAPSPSGNNVHLSEGSNDHIESRSGSKQPATLVTKDLGRPSAKERQGRHVTLSLGLTARTPVPYLPRGKWTNMEGLRKRASHGLAPVPDLCPQLWSRKTAPWGSYFNFTQRENSARLLLLSTHPSPQFSFGHRGYDREERCSFLGQQLQTWNYPSGIHSVA